MKTPTSDDLAKQLETLIQAHIAQCRAAVQAAVNRAFIDSVAGTPTGPTKARAPRGTPRTGGAGTKRRTAGDLQALAEKLYAQVCANPGETMAALAIKMDSMSRDLHRPMAALKKSGRVRDVGQRSQTQYFPMDGEAANAD